MKRFKGFNPMLFAAAVIFLCVTVYGLVSNVTVYVRQRNWPVTTATVIDVAEKRKRIQHHLPVRGPGQRLHREAAPGALALRLWGDPGRPV